MVSSIMTQQLATLLMSISLIIPNTTIDNKDTYIHNLNNISNNDMHDNHIVKNSPGLWTKGVSRSPIIHKSMPQ